MENSPSHSLAALVCQEATTNQENGPSSVWEPLSFRRNEFRILRLLDVTNDNEEQIIHARLQKFPINKHPPYYALSYCWGTSERAKNIILHGRAHQITQNLYDALLTVMGAGITSLWVDALCIDQNENDEKAAQVFRMANIFQEAESVLIWLGLAYPFSQQLLRFMTDSGLGPGTSTDIFWGQPLLATIARFGTDLSIFHKDFQNFLDHEYWQRTFVVQEIAVGKNIRLFCGTDTIEGAKLAMLFSKQYWKQHQATAYQKWERTSYHSFQHMVDLWSVRHSARNRKPMDMLTLLSDLSESQTSLRLDRVYAIMGLVHDRSAFISEPDYDLTPNELCVLMTKRFIEVTGSLDLFRLRLLWEENGNPHVLQKDLPSWCCPFTSFDGYLPFKDDSQAVIRYINNDISVLRCGTLESCWKTTEHNILTDKGLILENRVLMARGLRLGTITDPRDLCGKHAYTLLDSISRLVTIHSRHQDEEGWSRQFTIWLILCAVNQPWFIHEDPEARAGSQSRQRYTRSFLELFNVIDLWQFNWRTPVVADSDGLIEELMKRIEEEVKGPDHGSLEDAGEGNEDTIDILLVKINAENVGAVLGLLISLEVDGYNILQKMLGEEGWKGTESIPPDLSRRLERIRKRIVEEVLRIKGEIAPQVVRELAEEETTQALESVFSVAAQYSKRIFTDTSSIGLVQSLYGYDLPGAELWLLPGSSMPVILRKLEGKDADDRPTYRIISEALVDTFNIRGEWYNVMNGDAWWSAPKEDFQWVSIV